MIGMTFLSFLALLVVAVVVSAAMFYACKIRLAAGLWMQLIVGWVGAWLGSPVFGHWFESVRVGSIYIIPAVVGAVALTWCCRAREKEQMAESGAEPSPAPAPDTQV